jgi:hypothetical protein
VPDDVLEVLVRGELPVHHQRRAEPGDVTELAGSQRLRRRHEHCASWLQGGPQLREIADDAYGRTAVSQQRGQRPGAARVVRPGVEQSRRTGRPQPAGDDRDQRDGPERGQRTARLPPQGAAGRRGAGAHANKGVHPVLP